MKCMSKHGVPVQRSVKKIVCCPRLLAENAGIKKGAAFENDIRKRIKP